MLGQTKIASVSLLAIMSAAYVHCALAADSCTDVLTNKVADTMKTRSDQNSQLALSHARCLQAANDSSGSTSEGASGTAIGYGDAQVNRHQSSSQKSSGIDCGDDNAEQHTSAMVYYTETVWHDAVDAWRQCMLNRHEFTCWAEKGSDDAHVILNFDWDVQSAPPKVTTSNYAVGGGKFKVAWPAQTQLLLGANTFAVDRSPTEAITMSVSASPDSYVSKACTISLPGRPIKTPGEAGSGSNILVWECWLGKGSPPVSDRAFGPAPACPVLSSSSQPGSKQCSCPVYNSQGAIIGQMPGLLIPPTDSLWTSASSGHLDWKRGGTPE